MQPRHVILCLAMTACSGTDGGVVPHEATIVRDSAGVRYVINLEPQWDSADGWRVSDTPILSLGTSDGSLEETFFQVRGAVRLSDGLIAVLDAGSRELRYFEPDGRFTMAVAGPGEGPGEFQHPVHLERLGGDTLQVTDRWYRIRFGRDGSLISHETLPAADVLAMGGFRSEGCNLPSPLFLHHGVLLCQGDNDVRTMPRRVGPWTLENLIVHSPWSLDRVDTLRSFLGRRAWVVARDGRYWYTEPPLSEHGIFAVSGLAGRLAHASSQRYRIEIHGLDDGSLQMVVERPAAVRPPSEAELEDGWQRAALTIRGATTGELRSLLPVPDLISEATRIHFDASGLLWVRLRSPEASGQTPYDVFRDDGIWLGALMLADELTIFEIGDDYILGVERDHLDVERVVMYRLDRRGSDPPAS